MTGKNSLPTYKNKLKNSNNKNFDPDISSTKASTNHLKWWPWIKYIFSIQDNICKLYLTKHT